MIDYMDEDWDYEHDYDLEEPCPDCETGVVLKTGDLDPRGVYAVCSDRCGWSA